MSPSLDKYLCDKYPKIFADRCKSPQETCMCWGIDTGDGWFFLIDSLCASIQEYVDNPDYKPAKTFKNFIKKPLIWICDKFHWYKIRPSLDYINVQRTQIVADQVKSKFSGLRFYYHGGDDVIDGMVRFAENLSYCICENCGVMNETVMRNRNGWIETLCNNCMRPEKKENSHYICDEDLLKIWKNIKEKFGNI